jgi:ABC-2 type transport system permease protein
VEKMSEFKVVYILWLRQLKRYFRSKARIIGSLGQPLLFLVALGFGFGPIFAQAGGGNYIQFLVPGIISMGILFTSIFSGIEIIWDRQFGFLKETMVAPVSRISIMIGRTLGGSTVAIFQGLIIMVLSTFIGFKPASLLGLFAALIYMILVSLIFTALGTAIASVMEDMHGFQLIMNFLIMPLFFFSGALFPINNLPKPLIVVTSINPLAYGVDSLRYFLLGSSHYLLWVNTSVLIGLTVLLLILGSYLFSRIQV